MLSAAILALGLAATPAECALTPVGPVLATGPVASDTLAALYEQGIPWEAFLEAASSRRQTWIDNYAEGTPAPEQVARALAVPGRWRFLVVTVDSCGDSANTIPYLARLVELLPQVEMRIISPTVGAGVQAAHPTEDGRSATPTVILLDEAGVERGCWVERPYALRKALADHAAGVTTGNRMDLLAAWRAADAGRSTVSDLVDLLELAAAGTARCP